MNQDICCFPTALLRSLGEWWPEPEKSADLPAPKRRHLGLFVRGMVKKRRTNKAQPKAKAKSKAKAAPKKQATKNKKQHKKFAKLKKAKREPIPNVESNFKKNGVGARLVKQEMERAKHLDKSKFPDFGIHHE